MHDVVALLASTCLRHVLQAKHGDSSLTKQLLDEAIHSGRWPLVSPFSDMVRLGKCGRGLELDAVLTSSSFDRRLVKRLLCSQGVALKK